MIPGRDHSLQFPALLLTSLSGKPIAMMMCAVWSVLVVAWLRFFSPSFKVRCRVPFWGLVYRLYLFPLPDVWLYYNGSRSVFFLDSQRWRWHSVIAMQFTADFKLGQYVLSFVVFPSGALLIWGWFSVTWRYGEILISAGLCRRSILSSGPTTTNVLVPSMFNSFFHGILSGDSLLIFVQVVATILAGTTQLGVQAWYRDYYLVRVDCSSFLRMFAHIPWVRGTP